MNTKQLSLSIIFLCSTLSAIAQPDTISQFYKYNYDIAIDQIEREHIPLDGNKVKMIPFRVDEYYGFVQNDEEQKWLIQPEYDQVFAVYEEGAIVKKDHGYGFGYGLINEKNEWLIYPDFHNLFKNGDLFHGLIEGVIDTSLPDYYDSYILNLYFDKQGNMLFGEKAHDLQTFKGNDTLAWFRLGRDYHIRSRSGKLVKSFRATENKRFIGISDNLLVFSEEEDSVSFCRAYNVNGELIFTLPGSHKFINGLYQLSENLYGFVSYDGDVAYHYFSDSLGNDKPYKVITPTWPGLLHPNFNYFEEPFGATFLQPGFNYFDKEAFIVTDRKTKLMGLINRKGEVVIDFRYQFLDEFIHGIAFCTTEKGTNQFIDREGNVILEINKLNSFPGLTDWNQVNNHILYGLHEHVNFYEDLCIGMSYILINEKNEKGEANVYIRADSTRFFYYNRNGENVLELDGDIKFAGYFYEGLAPATNSKDELGFINKKGEWAIKPAYELAAAGAYPLPYLVIPRFQGGFAYIKSFKGYIDKNGKPYFSGKRMQDKYDFSH